MIGIGRVWTLAMDLEHFLPPKIHGNLYLGDKITNFFAIPIISINAPLKIFVLPCIIPDHVGIAYSVNYRWF